MLVLSVKLLICTCLLPPGLHPDSCGGSTPSDIRSFRGLRPARYRDDRTAAPSPTVRGELVGPHGKSDRKRHFSSDHPSVPLLTSLVAGVSGLSHSVAMVLRSVWVGVAYCADGRRIRVALHGPPAPGHRLRICDTCPLRGCAICVGNSSATATQPADAGVIR